MSFQGKKPLGWTEFHTQLHSVQMRSSQVEAFQQILDSGLLSRMRFLVYQKIHEAYLLKDTLTSGEIDRLLSSELETWTRAASPRLNELVRLGVIQEMAGKRVCRATGMSVLHYTVMPGALPQKEEEDASEKPPRRASPEEVQVFLECLIQYERHLTQEDQIAMEPVFEELFYRLRERKTEGL